MTTLNCDSWMQSQNGQNPCIVAQEVGQLCNSSYVVSSINFQESQYVPNTTTANGCTCCWSIYNLLSACAYCVGESQLISWDAWTASCGGYVSNSFLPSGDSLSQGIPYWAITDPTNWTNGVFNVTQASAIGSEVKPDITGTAVPTYTTTTSSSSSSSSNTPVGAIVGGVIGGVAIVVISGVLVLCLLRRRRRYQQTILKNPVGVSNGTQPNAPYATPMRGPNGVTVQPVVYSPVTVRSPTVTSPSLTSLVSPVSVGYSSNGHATTLSDAAAYMISPFYGQTPQPAAEGPSTSTSKAAEARAERAASPPPPRARLNPPPYSPTASSPESTETPATWRRRLSTKKYTKRMSSLSGVTTRSVSTQESVTPRGEPSRSHSTSEVLGGVERQGSQRTNAERGVASDERPPAI